jgi:mono/diheme cytochrome c family protein
MGLVGAGSIALGAVLLFYAGRASGVIDAVAAIAPRPDLKLSSPLVRGEQIYQRDCASCHGGASGGALNDYPPKQNANGHSWHHADCELESAILTGQAPPDESVTKPASPPAAVAMPAWRERLSRDEVRDVIAFVKTMWTQDQRASQERVTRERCAGS